MCSSKTPVSMLNLICYICKTLKNFKKIFQVLSNLSLHFRNEFELAEMSIMHDLFCYWIMAEN
ncbi:hypothetical protein BpHYR1_016948 [Brachionus plicatilis]|uniref:Uncharacterized protein n=1 Tax=Brachionus plicatilis TaxID=10195 RepID=A0A3M7SSC1_BRAPC|nr:hypothetical protein BpHYR1_016948 [Brachionus plicatilis]